ncbi:ribbon-helix-helix protein, CopG family [Ruegeria spongiae]|uniref:ribbon-helix-helix protein, CopG family n=1 Tax=Ruegeria spongiae TaxID=2942209 RepID=UPI003570AFBC
MSFKESDHEHLSQIAEANDVSLSWVVRQAVSEYLDRNKINEPGLPLPRPQKGER